MTEQNADENADAGEEKTKKSPRKAGSQNFVLGFLIPCRHSCGGKNEDRRSMIDDRSFGIHITYRRKEEALE
jgi:hypothetical protein